MVKAVNELRRLCRAVVVELQLIDEALRVENGLKEEGEGVEAEE